MSSSGSVSVFTLLGVLFVGLKLGGAIAWSWWWVTIPFWGPAVALFVVWALILSFVAIAQIFE
tara:strand:+ start:43 stop:231 length:189 start_codon:yes stop_codon:yes gene_type:complete